MLNIWAVDCMKDHEHLSEAVIIPTDFIALNTGYYGFDLLS